MVTKRTPSTEKPQLPSLMSLMHSRSAAVDRFFEQIPENCSPFGYRDGNDNNIFHLSVQTGISGVVERAVDKLKDRGIRMGLASQEAFLRNKQGDTPLHIAVKAKDDRLLDLLCSAGMPVNLSNKNHQTALHHLASSKYISEHKLKVLLERGADTGICDRNGNTPLHLLIESNPEEFSTLLHKIEELGMQEIVEKNLSVKNRDGMSAQDIALAKLETLPQRQQELRDDQDSIFSLEQRLDAVAHVDQKLKVYERILKVMDSMCGRSRSPSLGVTDKESVSSQGSVSAGRNEKGLDSGYLADSEHSSQHKKS